uniref:Secreted protein n=1 Tax=Steinernema glaseri TaxID=37863 RepID=A0A1I7YAQ4_9BILA
MSCLAAVARRATGQNTSGHYREVDKITEQPAPALNACGQCCILCCRKYGALPFPSAEPLAATHLCALAAFSVCVFGRVDSSPTLMYNTVLRNKGFEGIVDDET